MHEEVQEMGRRGKRKTMRGGEVGVDEEQGEEIRGRKGGGEVGGGFLPLQG